MRIFDTHTHVFPDKIAHMVISHLRAQSNNIPAYTDGTAGDHAAKSLKAGYSGWMNCPVITKPGRTSHTNQWGAEHNSGPAYSLGGLHPDDADISGILHELKDFGLWGIKMHPEYQSFFLDEPRMEKIWDEMEKEDIRLLLHSGDDAGFAPPYHSRFKDFVAMARRHPGLKILAAHLGSWDRWDEVEQICLEGNIPENLYLDTAFTLTTMKDSTQMTRIIRAIGADKVLYGTDAPWADPQEYLKLFSRLDLTEGEKKQIFWNNAVQFWRLPLTLEK